jgi:hypothetical protein
MCPLSKPVASIVVDVDVAGVADVAVIVVAVASSSYVVDASFDAVVEDNMAHY